MKFPDECSNANLKEMITLCTKFAPGERFLRSGDFPKIDKTSFYHAMRSPH